MRKNILVTGPPGCGKSTLVIRLSKAVPCRARGFTTEEIRSASGAREGFRISTLSGRAGTLAHKRYHEGPRVGSYRVNLADLDAVGAAELEEAVADPATELVVVDEIARMELHSQRFRRAVLAALDCPKPLLGALQMRADPFLDAVRARADTLVVTIERGRIEEAERSILDELKRALGA